MDPISVMLVDDNAGFMRATAQFLEAQKDMAVTGTAESGAEALEMARNLKPQVILVDLAMPGMPGLEAISHLRRMLPETGIIALTVMNTSSFRKAALDAGADSFIAKPAMRASLLPTIRRIARNGKSKKDKKEEAAPAAQEEQPISSRRVLLMEDDDFQRRLYARVLHSAGYIVDEADTLQQARELLDQHQFGIFLCDIHMGRERGTDLVRERYETFAQNGTQVVMISADTRYRALCKEMGVARYLEKPISLVHLVEVLNDITRRL